MMNRIATLKIGDTPITDAHAWLTEFVAARKKANRNRPGPDGEL
jgi:hypothetical protein